MSPAARAARAAQPCPRCGGVCTTGRVTVYEPTYSRDTWRIEDRPRVTVAVLCSECEFCEELR